MNEHAAITAATDLHLSPLTPSIGAEASGVDLGPAPRDTTVEAQRRALLEWKVLFLADQDITTEAHLAFARAFDDLEVHPFAPRTPGYPEVLAITHDRESRSRENTWHSDITWRAAMGASRGAQGRATDLAECSGGQRGGGRRRQGVDPVIANR